MRLTKSKSSNDTRRIFIAATLASALGAALFAAAVTPAAAQSTLDKIKKSGEMVVGTSASYPPFEYHQGSDIVGFDIDMGNEIARRMGVKIKWVEIDFKGIIAALKSKRVDLLITALTETPQRAGQISFSQPYFDAGIGAAKPKGSAIAEPKDLNGKTVGVQIGTSGEHFVRDNIKGVKEIKTYDTILLALKDLENGRVDAVVNPLPFIKYNLRGTKGLDVTKV
jgi:ABC-type amino acid transport substrate-binding protein